MKVFPITKERYLKSSTAHAHKAVIGALQAAGTLSQFTPFCDSKTDTGSCVLTNGLARSGTMLLHTIAANLGKWEDVGVFINSDHWLGIPTAVINDLNDWVLLPQDRVEPHQCLARFAVKKLRNGQVAAGHLAWSKGLERAMTQETPNRRIKHIFIYRDPRDAFVSQMNWQTYSDKFVLVPSDRQRRKFMLENFPNDEERLSYFIEGRLKWDFSGSVPWLHNTHGHTVRFEDLYPDIDGLRHGLLGDTLRGLLTYLEVDAATIDPMDLYDRVFGKSYNSSREENKVGQYKRVFKDQHYALLDTPEFRDTLREFGYEW